MDIAMDNIEQLATQLGLSFNATASLLVLAFCIVASAFSGSVHPISKGTGKGEPIKKYKIPLPKDEEGDVSLGELQAGTWEFRCGADPEREEHLGIITTGTKIGRAFWRYVPKMGSKSNKKNKTTQARVDEAAAMAKSFDRSVNANAADLPFRSQLVGESKPKDAKGSFIPSKSSKMSAGEAAVDAAVHGSVFYEQLQVEHGQWSGDYGGPLFLMPGTVIACHVTGIDLGLRRKQAMLRYLINHQQSDGGWGTHIEGMSTMFGSVLNYVAARLLGLTALADEACKARLFIRAHGGAVMAPQWCKFWISVLGVHEWDGCNPVPPELWTLPYWFPFHPGRMWCHARMVYLPMSAVYGARFVYPHAETDLLTLALREELYTECYGDINWAASRDKIASIDVYSPQSSIMTFLNTALYYTLESPKVKSVLGFVLNPLRRAGLKFAFDYIRAEDIQTNWVDIGPVNKAMNIVATFADRGGDDESFRRHIPRIEDYLWVAEDGMKMQGYNGSQLWDTGFAATGIAYAALAHDAYQTTATPSSPISSDSGESRTSMRTRSSRKQSRKKQEVVDSSDSDASGTVVVSSVVGNGPEADLPDGVTRALRGSFKYFDNSQVRVNEDNKERWFRHISKGGWPFSTQDHGWPISDCTAEGLKTCLLLETPVLRVLGDVQSDKHDKFGKLETLGRERYEDAVNVVLSMQNLPGDGGWASYEKNRGWDWYELLNPALVFGDIMIDYSYVECTSACVQSLCKFASVHGDDYNRMEELVKSVVEGAKFINRKQRKDGAWYGSWAVCFTYGAWFGCEGLAATMDLLAKEPTRATKYDKLMQESRVKLASGVDYLLTMQSEDGGWGESVKACAMKRYVPNEVEGSQVVNTAWALLSLVRAREALDEHGMAGEKNNNSSKDDEEWKAIVDVACEKAALFLRERQLESGDWKQESVSGVFNKSCAISYTAYRNAFPIWALARFALWCKANEE